MRTALSATIVSACLCFAGCSAAPTATPPVADAPLVKIGTDGGMCQYGMCSGAVLIYADGRCVHEQPQQQSAQTRLADADITKLKQAITDVDLAAVKSHPFTGTCPIAYDGSRTTYEFVKDGAMQTLNDCEYDLDEPLFKLIDGLSC